MQDFGRHLAFALAMASLVFAMSLFVALLGPTTGGGVMALLLGA